MSRRSSSRSAGTRSRRYGTSSIRQNLEPLGLEHLAIGQLCLGGPLAEQFRTGGPACEGLRQLKAEGLVGRFVLEVWPWTSDVPVDALRGGYADGLIDGYIFYLNPLQRFASDDLWDLCGSAAKPSSRCGRSRAGLCTESRRHGPDYLKARAAQVLPLFERSGCGTWTEFCARFAFGFPQVVTTVGATSRTENLREFLDAVREVRRRCPPTCRRMWSRLQRRWAEEHDRHAEPWSM